MRSFGVVYSMDHRPRHDLDQRGELQSLLCSAQGIHVGGAIGCNIWRRVQRRVAVCSKHQGHQQPSGPTVAVWKRMDRFEVRVRNRHSDNDALVGFLKPGASQVTDLVVQADANLAGRSRVID